MEEAVSFEPTRGPYDDERGLTEKRISNGSIGGSPISGSNMSHGPFAQHPVAPHQQFYDQEQGYGHGAHGHQTYALPSQMTNDAYGGIQPGADHYNVVNAAAPATTHSNANLFYRWWCRELPTWSTLEDFQWVVISLLSMMLTSCLQLQMLCLHIVFVTLYSLLHFLVTT
jgi:hypothetical protein